MSCQRTYNHCVTSGRLGTLCFLLRWQGGKAFLMSSMHGCGAGLTSTKMNSSMSSSANTPLTWSMTMYVSTPTTTKGWCHQASVGRFLLNHWRIFRLWSNCFHLVFFLSSLTVGLSLQNTGEFHPVSHLNCRAGTCMRLFPDQRQSLCPTCWRGTIVRVWIVCIKKEKWVTDLVCAEK